MRKKLTPEARLANYWRKRTGLEWSDFDIFQGETPPSGVNSRSSYWIFDIKNSQQKTVSEVLREISFLIIDGHPLNFAEYHLAVANYLILGDGVPYEEFYRKHWYETSTNRGYGKPPKKITKGS